MENLLGHKTWSANDSLENVAVRIKTTAKNSLMQYMLMIVVWHLHILV